MEQLIISLLLQLECCLSFFNIFLFKLDGEQKQLDEEFSLQDLILQCSYKFFLGLILLGCVIFIYLVYCYYQPSSESYLKMQILKEVQNKYIPPQFYETEIFPQSFYLDYPFKLFSYLDKEFANYLQLPINQSYCYLFNNYNLASSDVHSEKSLKYSQNYFQYSNQKTKSTSYQFTQGSDTSDSKNYQEQVEKFESNPQKKLKQSQSKQYQTHFQSLKESQDNQCFIKNAKFFEETFIPILYVHGHGKGNPQQINSLNQQLQNLLIYENEKNLEQLKYKQKDSKSKLKTFKFYAVDFKNSLSEYSIQLIDKQSASISRAIQYIQSRTLEKVIVICHSIGGLVCLNTLSTLPEEYMNKIQQVIFLNSPLTQHPLNSNTAFNQKYKSIYKNLNDRKQFFDGIKVLSFTSGSSDNHVIPEETHLRVSLKNSAHFNTQNLRDVFVTLSHDDILTYTPFLSLLAKYLVMDNYYNIFFGDIKVIKHFFTQFDIHYEDQIDRKFFQFSKKDLDQQCSVFIPKFEQSASFDLLSQGKKLKYNQEQYQKNNQQDPRQFLIKQNLLCVKILTQNIKASNLFYYMRTNLPSQNIKLFTYKYYSMIKLKQNQRPNSQQKNEETRIFDSDEYTKFDTFEKEEQNNHNIQIEQDISFKERNEELNQFQNILQIQEIFPQFSYFFSTSYLHPHQLQDKEIYLVYTLRNDTYLQNEYQYLFNQTYNYKNLFFSISNYQDSEKITYSFSKIKKEQWMSNQYVMNAKVEKIDDSYLYKYCTSTSGSLFSWFTNDNTKQILFQKWNRLDYNILILKDTTSNQRLHISFSYGENDCDFVDILNAQNKDITFIHNSKNEDIQRLYKDQKFKTQAYQYNIQQDKQNDKKKQSLYLNQESNIVEYARQIGKFSKVIILNMHVLLCCILISIQMKYYDPTCLQDAPSHISIICDNLSKIILYEGLAVFSIIQLQKFLFYDGMRKQVNFIFHNIQPVEHFASSFLTSFIITFATISTYILTQFVFYILSFISYLLCSLFKYILLELSPIQSFIKSRYFFFINAFTLIFPLLFLTNYHLKWVILFLFYWILLGALQANHQQYGHTINILNGFAYLVLLYFVLNIHCLQSGFEQLKSLDKIFKNLLFTEEFTNEFISIICWFFILTKIENLVSSIRNALQILLILLSLFLFFFIFQSVQYSNDYLCKLSYLLVFFTIYYHNYQAKQITPCTQQSQQQQQQP